MSYFTPSLTERDLRRTSIAAREAAAACDLSKLDNSPEWTTVGPRVKEFIKGALCLDEKQRLTAKEALESPWFSAGRRKENLARYYECIIRGWKPQIPFDDFAEDLKDFLGASGLVTDVMSFSPQCSSCSHCEGQASTSFIQTPKEGVAPFVVTAI